MWPVDEVQEGETRGGRMDAVLTLPRYRLRDVPPGVWLGVGLLALLLFAVGYDQGSLLQLALGEAARTNNFLHELFHDGRHLLGFPCH
jgi:hypothetical protein